MVIKRRVLFVLLLSFCLVFCSCGTQNRISDEALSDEAISDTDSLTESDAENTVFIENVFSSEEETGVLIDLFGEGVSSHGMEYPMATDFVIQEKSDYDVTDEQLMLLEQLIYLNEDVAGAAEIPYVSPTDSVEKILLLYDDEALARLEEKSDIGTTHSQGNEWAAVIRAIKSDPDLMKLKLTSTYTNENGKEIALCFEDPDVPEQAVVVFKGTSGVDEWYDNVEGLNVADTACQQDALNYIESLPYSHITVAGHSKGGNKAQYVTILSDKVTRCVSMDGFGFSQEFIDKYRAEILEKGSAIKNYSLDNDYVHILMFPVPGSEQIYCEGDGIANWKENHSSISFFHYTTDEDGHSVVVYGSDGTVYLEFTDENESLTYLHEFVCFILNVMPDEDKDEIIVYLEDIILKIALERNAVSIDDVNYTVDNLSEYPLTDPEMAIVAAYLLKYIDTCGLTEDQVFELLRAFGLGDIADEIQETLDDHFLARLGLSGGKSLMNLFLDNIRDGEEDPIIEILLNCIMKKLDIDFDAASFWRSIEENYAKIGEVDKLSATKDATVKSGKTLRPT
ncbi:MAG: DUF2974 domain-containing protein [Clostridiales bacterium]|nr:DUF2974 domain-containing protein [Clostridiales bacterium]